MVIITRSRMFLSLLVVIGAVLMAAGCAPGESSASPEPPSPIPTQPPAVPTAAEDLKPPDTPTPVPNPVPTEIVLPTVETPIPELEPAALPTRVPVDEIILGMEDLPFEEFADRAYRELMLRDRDALISSGFADLYGISVGEEFTDISAEFIQDTQMMEYSFLDQLRSYDRESLPYDQQISYDALERYLDVQVRAHSFSDLKFYVNPVWGLQNYPGEFLLEMPLESVQDVEIYIARLSNVAAWADQVIAALERNEGAGALPPKFVLDDTLSQFTTILNTQAGGEPEAEHQEVFNHLRSEINRIEGISGQEKTVLLDSALKAVEKDYIPSFQAVQKKLEALAGSAEEDPNVWVLPGGEAYYDQLLAYYSGTDLTADEIHEMTRAEVARIQAEIREAAVAAGYPDNLSMAELNRLMEADSRYITGAELREKYQAILDAANLAADDYFNLRAEADVVLRSDPEGPPAFYSPPPPGSSEEGAMVTNLGFSPLYVNYNEHVLMHHETIPGHHTQIALAQELDVPLFQRYFLTNPYLMNYAFQAYPEGWALYAESLAEEMGLYEGDEFANLGRLRLRLLRFVRSVVDTGLHAKGWTLDEAAAYLEEATGMPQPRNRLSRYLVNPSYPNGYNVGGLKIIELRTRAMDQLGEAFDIKEFHDVVLGHGTLPIIVLEDVVDDWIAEKLGG